MNEQHLFACEPCRADWRVRRAFKKMPRLSGLETDVPVDEVFVERVLASVREERRRHARLTARLAAAAALLFFFFAGAGRQSADSADTVAEQSYAQLATPSALDGLLPE